MNSRRSNWIDEIDKEINKRVKEKRLGLSDDQTYPLNYQKLEEWINKHHKCDEDIQIFTRYVIGKTKYVSFVEFISKFQQSIMDFLNQFKTIKEKNPNAYWVLYRGWDQNKSNNWLALIMVFFLKLNTSLDMYPTCVSSQEDFTIEQHNFAHFAKDYNDPNAYIVCCDDASYSGFQLTEQLSVKRNFTPTFNLILLVPYITDKASQYILSWLPNCTFYTQERLYTAYELLEKIGFFKRKNVEDIMHFEEKLAKQFKTNSLVLKDCVPVYFDHKIADSVSSFPTIYASGVTAECANDPFSFIERCEPVPLEFSNVGTSKEDKCAPPFYKAYGGGTVKENGEYTSYCKNIVLFFIKEKIIKPYIIHRGKRYRVYGCTKSSKKQNLYVYLNKTSNQRLYLSTLNKKDYKFFVF